MLVACTDSRAPGQGTGAVSSPGEDGGSVDDAAETSPSVSSSAPVDTSGVNFDVGMATAAGTGAEGGDASGCDKVDFLFVIDNSGSMGDEQENLIANFPQFMETIQTTLDEAQDYHVMVIDTDAWVFEICPMFCALPPGMICLPAPGFVCGSEPLECEDVLGAGVEFPRGAAATETDCNFASGKRYMDSSEPDLAGTFACAAKVGTGSTALNAERPMEAMVAAVTPSTPAWGCNDGFLRDDAILVVTFITDEDDNVGDGSGGTVEGWRQALISAKKGDPNAIVVLGLFGDNDQPGGVCAPFDPDASNGAEPSPRLREFTESWGDHGVAGSVCAPSYQQFFVDAVSVIDTTCDAFVPPAG